MLATKIGFLPLSWDVWDVDGWGEKLRDRCVNAMEQIPGIELVVPPKALTKGGCVGEDLEEAEKALALLKEQDIQGLIIGNMNFGVELAVGTVLSGLRKDMPILHFSTRSAPYAKDGVRGTDTWCGSFMAAAAIYRRGFNYTHIHTCMPEDAYFSQKIDRFARAVCAISRFKGAKFAQIATRPRLFESQNYSEQALQKNFSQRIEYVDIDTLFGMMEEISPDCAEVKAVADDIVSGVRVVETADDTLVNMARFELALKRIYHEYKVCALAPSCWTRLQERFHIAACATFGRLNDQGIITACEVDVLGAITMWAMHCASYGKAIPDFIDFTDLHPTEQAWLAWHCGNAAGCLCAPGCEKTLRKNIQLIQWGEKCHGATWFRLKEGPVTAGRLVEYDGQFTFFFGSGEIVDIPPATTGTYGWVKVNDVMDWENKMAMNGIIHHGALIHDAAVADALELFCQYLGIRAVRGK